MTQFIDESQLAKARHRVRATIALMPIYIPEVNLLHDGDTGLGHVVSFYDMVKAGPNRVAFVGEPLQLNAEESYTRGGALATGHQWRVYAPDMSGPAWINHYAIGSDTLVFGPENGAEVFWTPEIATVHRIECRTSNRKSDGSTDARRWVRVFASDEDTELREVIDLQGTGSIDSGGYSVQITIKSPGGIENLNDWSTVVLMLRTYYNESEHNMDSQGPKHVPTIQFSGFIAENSITWNRQAETMTFTLRTPDYALSRMAIRGYPKMVDTTIGDPPVTYSIPADYPLFFGNPDKAIALPGGTTFDVVSYIRQSDLGMPVHQIHGMTFSDPMYHLLQRHTNYASWWDIELWQDTLEASFPFAFQISNVFDQIKSFQDKRLGVVYCDKKGQLWIIPDVMFQSDVWFLTYNMVKQMTFNTNIVKEVQLKRQPYRVSQVKLTGMNDANFPFFSRWPDIPDVRGDVVQRSAMMAPDQVTMNAWAYRMFVAFNHHELVTITPVGINKSLELSDLVQASLVDHTGFFNT